MPLPLLLLLLLIPLPSLRDDDEGRGVTVGSYVGAIEGIDVGVFCPITGTIISLERLTRNRGIIEDTQGALAELSMFSIELLSALQGAMREPKELVRHSAGLALR